MFEKATKNKYRFASAKGNLTVEDLWDLPLTHARSLNLDDFAKDLDKDIKENDVTSFVTTTTAVNDELEIKFAIVKHIIKVKLTEAAAARLAMENKRRRQQILCLINDKKNDELRGKTIEELEAMIIL